MLEHINEQLSNIITYELGEYTDSTIQFPYWVGELQEINYQYEEDFHEYTFTLTGTNKDTYDKLFEDKEKILNLFNEYKVILPSGRGVAIYYESAFMIPSQDSQIRRLQVQLHILEWGY